MWAWFKQWFHKWGSPKWFYDMSLPWAFWTGLIGGAFLVVGVIWGLMFAPTDFKQGDSFRIIYLHVPAAAVSMSCYMMVAILGAVHLIWKMKVPSMIAKQMIPLGTTFSAVTLFSGAIWGIPTWGDWWVWDARLTSMLVQLLLFLGLWALYAALENEATADKATAVLALFGVVNIPIIKYSVEWWNTLHQPATFSITRGSQMAAEMAWPLLVCVIGMYLAFTSIVLVRARIEVLRRSRKAKWAQIELDNMLEQKYGRI